MSLPRYDTSHSYAWNYDHPPEVVGHDAADTPGDWTYCGSKVSSPLGVAAGPLLNGAWCLYYAALGFDVLTYKTVRSRDRTCYPLPNLLPLDAAQVHGGEQNLAASGEFRGSWAISFGMPSRAPETWTADVADTRRQLATDKKLAVSVVGTHQEGWSIERLADDYAQCASLAKRAGADAVEINLSCPNVSSCDGQLYQNPGPAKLVADQARAAVGDLPLVAKIGHDPTEGLQDLVDALSESVDALSTTNCIAATVEGSFGGQPRGIGGRAILDESVRQVERLAEFIARRGYRLQIIGVGGVETAEDVRRYLSAGAECTHLATAVMRDPGVGLRIREELARG